MQNLNVNVTNITVNATTTSTNIVRCVGVSTHDNVAIGTKIRFSAQANASARVRTLVNTKLHSNIVMLTLTQNVTQLQAAIFACTFAVQQAEYCLTDEARKAGVKQAISEQQLSALQAFVNTHSTHEIDAATSELSTLNVQVEGIVK